MKNSEAKEDVVEQVEEVVEAELTEDEPVAQTGVKAMEDLQAQKLQVEQQLLRMTADFTNYRNRMARERKDIYLRANADLVHKVLPVVDNMERALVAAEDETVSTGVKMIYRQFMDILKEAGLEVVEALGQEFNPHFHEALMQEVNEDVDENTVLQVFEQGYLFKDKLLRPAKVKVSTK